LVERLIFVFLIIKVSLIRQYFPKGTDFNNISEAMLKEVEIALNSRLRKCLNYKTALEVLKIN
jgi:IS30 family transposase